MARPKKQTIEYFPHFVNSGKTMFVLESKYGNDGYSFWFKLLEILGSTNGMFYDCNNVANWEFLLAKTNLNTETANNILNTLSELDAIDKTLWERKLVWSQNLVDNVRDAFKRRIAEMPKKPLLHTETLIEDSFCIQKPIENDDSVNINGESKVKESKVKESKENKSSEETSCSLPNKETYQVYEQCGFGFLNTILTEMIDCDVGIYTKEWVAEAMKEAARQNKYKYSYVEGILRNWKTNGKEEHRGPTKQSVEDPNREGIGFEV